jgi:phage shock protein A
MENLNAEQAIKELENQTKYAKFIGSNGVLLSAKAAQFCLEHAQYYEQKIKQLTEEVASWKEIAEGYQKQFEDCAEDRTKLTVENERLRAELEQRPPKLIITKLLKKGNENV